MTFALFGIERKWRSSLGIFVFFSTIFARPEVLLANNMYYEVQGSLA